MVSIIEELTEAIKPNKDKLIKFGKKYISDYNSTLLGKKKVPVGSTA